MGQGFPMFDSIFGNDWISGFIKHTGHKSQNNGRPVSLGYVTIVQPLCKSKS